MASKFKYLFNKPKKSKILRIYQKADRLPIIEMPCFKGTVRRRKSIVVRNRTFYNLKLRIEDRPSRNEIIYHVWGTERTNNGALNTIEPC